MGLAFDPAPCLRMPSKCLVDIDKGQLRVRPEHDSGDSHRVSPPEDLTIS